MPKVSQIWNELDKFWSSFNVDRIRILEQAAKRGRALEEVAVLSWMPCACDIYHDEDCRILKALNELEKEKDR